MRRIPDKVEDGFYFIYEDEASGQYVAIYPVLYGFRIIAGYTKYFDQCHERFYCCQKDTTLMRIFYGLIYSFIDHGGDILSLPDSRSKELSNHREFISDILSLVGEDLSHSPEPIPFEEILEKEMKKRMNWFEETLPKES